MTTEFYVHLQPMEERITPYSLPETETHSFLFIHQHVTPQLEAKLHVHDAWELYYVTQGFGQRIAGDEMQPFSKGDVVLIPPKMPHRWDYSTEGTDADGNVSYLMLTFSGTFINHIIEVFPEVRHAMLGVVLPTEARRFRGTTAQTIQQRLVQMETMSEMDRLIESLRLLPFVFSTEDFTDVGRMNYTEKSVRRMMQISTYVMKHYQHAISLDDIAREVGMNRSSFCSYFKRQKGITFSQFVTRYRLATAAEMLRNSQRQVSDIAYAVGFSDLSHFVHTFTRVMGVSPTAYRKGHDDSGEYKNTISRIPRYGA